MLYFTLKLVHVLGAATLFGTGAGIAFFMWMAHLTGKPSLIAGTARVVVIADTLFTATAVILQPLTGAWLIHLLGYSFFDRWIAWSLSLYVLVAFRQRRALPRGLCRDVAQLNLDPHQIGRAHV